MYKEKSENSLFLPPDVQLMSETGHKLYMSKALAIYLKEGERKLSGKLRRSNRIFFILLIISTI